MNVSFLSTSSPTLALASPTRVKSALTKPHIRVPQLRVRAVEERKLASSQTDRQTDRPTHVRRHVIFGIGKLSNQLSIKSENGRTDSETHSISLLATTAANHCNILMVGFVSYMAEENYF